MTAINKIYALRNSNFAQCFFGYITCKYHLLVMHIIVSYALCITGHFSENYIILFYMIMLMK
jgi:hypothetical protein